MAGSAPHSWRTLPPPSEPAWQQVQRVVVTEGAAEAALAAMEDHRVCYGMYYGAAQAAAAERSGRNRVMGAAAG